MAAEQLTRPEPEIVSPVGAAASARDQVSWGAALTLTGLATTELAGLIEEVTRLENQVAGWRLSLAAEAARRREQSAEPAAETGADVWLARLTIEPREVARGGVRLGRLLEESYVATRSALAQGRLRPEQARVVVEAGERAPAGADPEGLRRVEADLVALATGEGTGRAVHARRLRVLARRAYSELAPDRAWADAHEDALVAAEEAHARAETYLSLGPQGDGTWRGSFVVSDRHALMLRTVLDRLTAPRALARDRRGATTTDHSVPQLSLQERRGIALCEAIEHLPTTGWHHDQQGRPATNRGAVGVLVHLGLDHLRGPRVGAGAGGEGSGHAIGEGAAPASLPITTGIATGDRAVLGNGVGWLDADTAISAGEARRLACEAGILPVVLGGRGQPLDLGRERRLHSLAQRQALSVLHPDCAIAGCERPFAWCEIHHPHPWSKGGPTDLDNALPLCAYHHQRTHDHRWRLHPPDPDAADEADEGDEGGEGARTGTGGPPGRSSDHPAREWTLRRVARPGRTPLASHRRQ